jgi:hypothetical protein
MVPLFPSDWKDYPDVLWMREHSLADLCDFFDVHLVEVMAIADGVRVVNSERLMAECKRRGLPVRTFATIRKAAEEYGVIDQKFYFVGFGPGLGMKYA